MMRGKQARHVVDPSLQPLREQQVVPLQFHGWRGLLVQAFPVFFLERQEFLQERIRRLELLGAREQQRRK